MSRGDVYLVMLNPARGDEIRNMRPCLVVSLNTFIVAPMSNEIPVRDVGEVVCD